ncbi:MAG TPA: hypothetical protein VM659_00545 [Dongiaceae bacterium]|nr:hypothetical protein [Dongiaceae bacterium]
MKTIKIGLLFMVSLLCLGGVSAADDLDKPMHFFMAYSGGNCEHCVWIAAEGKITGQTPDQFEAFVKANVTSASMNVSFHSGGGNLGAAMQLGQIIRHLGYTTMVGKTIGGKNAQSNSEGICACAYAFLGGVSRTIPGNGKIGVHQFSGSSVEMGSGDSLSDGQQGVAILSAYVAAMGADVKLVSVASAVKPGDIYWIPRDQLEALRVLNDKPVAAVWQIEPLRDGLRAILVQHLEYSDNRYERLSAFCLAQSPNTIIMTMEVDAHITQQQADEINQDSNGLTFWNKGAHQKWPPDAVKYRATPTGVVIDIVMSRKWFEVLLSTETIGIYTGMSHAIAGYIKSDGNSQFDFPTVGLREIIPVTLKNCVS